MAEELRKNFGAGVKLVPGHNGIFDVIVDEEMVFSKYEAGRFPNHGEVSSKLK